MDQTPKNFAFASSETLVGDVMPLAQALGSAEALASLAALAELVDAPRPESLSALRSFLARYRERFLTPIELPAIRDAYEHAARGEVRELVTLDRRLARKFGTSAFAEASRRIGGQQLGRLRPLRSVTLQRYLRAVEAGDADGWHVVVFGILLALLSLPLRQGLIHYATKTQYSLLDSATLGVKVSGSQRAKLRAECDAPVAPAIQKILPKFG